ncbi:MAG: hypothetical protein SGBAC_000328 [Bacillariaceae sp.]
MDQSMSHNSKPKTGLHTASGTRQLIRLAMPWALLVLVSIGSALVLSYATAAEEEDDWDRLLLESDSSSSSVHHHKQVYEEDHKSMFPLQYSDKVGFTCAIVGLMVAAGGGIGGGGILVPIYILVMGFTPKHAIPLSNITVFGGAIANSYLNAKKRHPLTDRPLVDWDLILVMEPLTIAGALMGAFLNKILPEIFLVTMLVILLSFTAYTTLKKAIKMYKLETIKMREQGFKPDGSKESELTQIKNDERAEDQAASSNDLIENMELQEGEAPADKEDEKNYSAELAEILQEERFAPKMNINILIGLFVVILSMNLLKGGGAFPSPIGITCGSGVFWATNIIMLVWILFITWYARSYLVKRFDTKARVGYKYIEGDIQWDARATVVYPGVCCLAGFFAGMFGVGGGIVKGPLMLAMGVHPAVASASSACMILFTSFTATTSFFVFGLLDRQYGPICFMIGLIATYFGQIGLSILMKRAQRNSYIAFSIGGVVLLSALLMTIQSLLSMAEGEHHKSGGICGHDS